MTVSALTACRPRHLKRMPRFHGDASDFAPMATAGDLLFAISSDHPYVNLAIARSIAHGYALPHGTDGQGPSLKVKCVEQGFGRPDKREFLRFDDGIDNLSNFPLGELDRLVYVQSDDDEPEWCVGGSYLVYRKIRENLFRWEHLDPDRREQVRLQEAMIGRHKLTGEPLSRDQTGADDMVPVYPDPSDDRDGPLAAHIRKVQPRRPYADIFGGNDLDRRFLRRPYPYFAGMDSTGEVDCGLHFLAFQRNPKQQFEWVTQMWQMNPDFPIAGTGIDSLYANGILTTVGGGYYFCPPRPQRRGDFLGSGLF